MNGAVLIKLCDLPKNAQSYIILDGALYTYRVPWGDYKAVGDEARGRLMLALVESPPIEAPLTPN